MNENVWSVTDEDHQRPEVGAMWVGIRFYGMGSTGYEYYKVVRTTPKQIVLCYMHNKDLQFKIRLSDLRQVGENYSRTSYYPLTEARKEHIAAEKIEKDTRNELKELLGKIEIRRLPTDKVVALLAAVKLILEKDEGTIYYSEKANG